MLFYIKFVSLAPEYTLQSYIECTDLWEILQFTLP